MVNWHLNRRRRESRRSRRLARGYEQLEARTLLHAAAGDLPEGEGIGATVPDFSLVDSNPSSPTYNQAVSPRDFLSQASLWYYGHST